MKQSFYGIFYAKTHSKYLSSFLSKCCYSLFIIKFFMRKLFIKNHPLAVKEEKAREIVEKVYPKPEYTMDIQAVPPDEKIDISVIIPIYNYRDIIESCIDSVLNQQTKYTFELILVDDGSTDGAAEIVDQYQNRKNVKVIHQKNAGIGGARNTGISHACGRYIMFADCDDYVHADFIETMLDEACRTNNDIVVCSYTLIKKKDGKILSEREIVCDENNIMGYKDPEDQIMNYQGLPWNKVYKREIFENVRYIPGFWYEDTITHFLLFRLCKSFSYVEKSLYDYMWYEGNFSHTQTKVSPKSLERYWLLEVMAEETKRVGLETDRGFYKVLLRHLGRVFYSGIHGFPEEVEQAAFLMGCALLRKYKPKDKTYHLTYMEKQLERALLEKNISKWALACQYQ